MTLGRVKPTRLLSLPEKDGKCSIKRAQRRRQELKYYRVQRRFAYKIMNSIRSPEALVVRFVGSFCLLASLSEAITKGRMTASLKRRVSRWVGPGTPPLFSPVTPTCLEFSHFRRNAVAKASVGCVVKSRQIITARSREKHTTMVQRTELMFTLHRMCSVCLPIAASPTRCRET